MWRVGCGPRPVEAVVYRCKGVRGLLAFGSARWYWAGAEVAQVYAVQYFGAGSGCDRSEFVEQDAG